jgi:hypothetical protein
MSAWIDTSEETADRVGCHFTVACDWIHRFNKSGVHNIRKGRQPQRTSANRRAEQLQELVEVALSNPQERGLSFSNWPVPKLAKYCRAKQPLPHRHGRVDSTPGATGRTYGTADSDLEDLERSTFRP